MDSQENSPSFDVQILSYNTLLQKNTFTWSVKNDPSWRNYSWQSRREQLILKILQKSPIIICLQQIRHTSKYTSPNFYEFQKPLSDMGFHGIFAKRNLQGQFGEEGLAIFFNRQLLHLVQTDVLYFEDGTGRLSLAVTLRSLLGSIFTVATTHIIYPSQVEKTKNQIKSLANWPLLSQTSNSIILTGDFNIISQNQDQMLQQILQKFNDAHKTSKCKKSTFSLNLSGSNSPGMIYQPLGCKIDYIFTSKSIKIASSEVLGEVADLSSINQPSDHLPVYATLIVPSEHETIVDDMKNLRDIFIEVRERDYNSDPKFKQFLDKFWLMPCSIKNAIYELTYKKAVQLNLYQQNYQFGRIAFTNNTFHIQTILDDEGNSKHLKWQVVKHNIIPHQVISQILLIIQERVCILPNLIQLLPHISFQEFLSKFDQLNLITCNSIYGEVYKISKQKGINNQHYEFGRLSFRQIEGWQISNDIRKQAMQRLRLP